MLVPSLPWPVQARRDSSRGLGSQIAKTQAASSPTWEAPVSSRLCLLCPSGQCLEPRPQERGHFGRQSQWPSLTCPPGLPAWSCVPGPSVFIASICAVLWARWPCPSAPERATIPSRPSLDPARTTVG